MKYLFISLFCCLLYSAQGQSTVKQPRLIQRSYMFSTDNPDGRGHIEWNFTDKMIYKEYVFKQIIKKDSFKTEKPFVFMDSGGIVIYLWETVRGAYAITYNDSHQDINWLRIGGFGSPMKSYAIYDIVHPRYIIK